VIRRLFALYRRLPFRYRNMAARAAWPLRLALAPFSRLHMGGYVMRLDFSDNASLRYLAEGDRYERVTMEAFCGTIVRNAPARVIDIGASYGIYTLAAARLATLGVVSRVVAVEPDARPFRSLRKAVEANGFSGVVDLHQFAASDAPGEVVFFTNARSSADNRSHEVRSAPIPVREQRRVPSAPLDALPGERSVSGERLIVKIDVQGNEPRVVRGMLETLRNASGYVVFFECSPYLIESAGNVVADFARLLSSLSPEGAARIHDDRIEPFSAASLEDMFGAVAAERETNMQGVNADFVIWRNAVVHLPGVAAAVPQLRAV
jgi:FkbM family methyltransferase